MNLIKKIYNKLVNTIGTCALGHKWSDDKAKQICLRDGCNATRILMYNKNPKIGGPSISWHYYNIDDINLE